MGQGLWVIQVPNEGPVRVVTAIADGPYAVNSSVGGDGAHLANLRTRFS